MISGVQDSIAKQSYEKGIGWQGEILNPRSKLVNGIRSTTYDFDRGLARHIPAWPLTDDMAKAESFGADFCLSFSVSNDHGEPVENAKVNVGVFTRHGSDEKSAISDSSGIATISGFGTGELMVRVTKDGYYGNSFRLLLFQPEFVCASDGKWLPWNPLLPVTLRTIDAPIIANAYDVTLKLPEIDASYGIDLINGKVVPVGSAEETFRISIHSNGTVQCREGKPEKMTLSFSGEQSGGMILKADVFSDLKWPKSIPSEGFSREIPISLRQNETNSLYYVMKEDDVIVFQSRKSDEMAFNGVIARPLSTTGWNGGWFTLRVYVSDIGKSTSLEPKTDIKLSWRKLINCVGEKK